MLLAADQTRRQIERDLHDGAQQRLVSLALELRIAQAEVSTGAGELGMHLDRAIEQVRGALEELRDLSRGIHPAILTEDGLGSALHEVTGRSPIPVQLQLGVDERLPDQIEISADDIVAEALTNAAKHSGASAITVTVERDGAHGALRDDIERIGAQVVDKPRGAVHLGFIHAQLLDDDLLDFLLDCHGALHIIHKGTDCSAQPGVLCIVSQYLGANYDSIVPDSRTLN